MTLATLPPSTRSETKARLDTLKFDTPGNCAISLQIVGELARSGKVSVARIVTDAAGITISIQEKRA
jgi:hypothetical protein